MNKQQLELTEMEKMVLQIVHKNLDTLLNNNHFDTKKDARETLRALVEIGFVAETDLMIPAAIYKGEQVKNV